MADDIIRSVASAADREQVIEELFFALYPRVARTAFGLVGDWDVAERAVGDAGHGDNLVADLALRRAVETLPYRKRACVVLRSMVGLSEAETADALGVSVGTVKSQTHKALHQLRDVLSEDASIAQRGIVK